MKIRGRLARREVGFDLVGEPMDVDDGARDARGGEAVEAMVDERLARDFDQRFRQSLGDRAHAVAAAGGEHHCGSRAYVRRPGHQSTFVNAYDAASGPSARGK